MWLNALTASSRRSRGRNAAVLERREHDVVVGVIDDHGDVLVILRGRAQHRGSADVDVLDRLRVRAVGARRRRFERIQIHDEQVDDADAVLDEHRVVDAASREQAAVNVRMQRLDAAVHDLGEARDGRDLGHGDSGVAQRLRGAARRDDFEAEPLERQPRTARSLACRPR